MVSVLAAENQGRNTMALVGAIRENLKLRTPGTWQVASAGTSRIDFQLCGETGCPVVQQKWELFIKKN